MRNQKVIHLSKERSAVHTHTHTRKKNTDPSHTHIYIYIYSHIFHDSRKVYSFVLFHSVFVLEFEYKAVWTTTANTQYSFDYHIAAQRTLYPLFYLATILSVYACMHLCMYVYKHTILYMPEWKSANVHNESAIL